MDERNTMYDYLKWRGDLTFDQDPFNEVDNLILAQLAYVDYEEIVPETRENAVPISEVSLKYWEIHTEEEIRKRESFVKLSPFLLKPVAGSRRFEKTRLCGYVNYVSKRAEAQMSATQFELEDGTIYIAYFAVFASSFSGTEVRDQILKVYSNDAPGFREEIVAKPEYEQVMAMTVNIIPQDSVIGRLLNAGRDAIVVKSSKKGIMQHDALSWEIQGNHFIPARRSSDSLYLEKVLSGWLENVDDESRKFFVEQIFGVLQTLGADTMKDVRQITVKELGEAIQVLRGIPKEQQEEMAEVLKKLVASGSRAFYEEMEHKEGLLPDVFKKLSSIKERIGEARLAAEAARVGVQAASVPRLPENPDTEGRQEQTTASAAGQPASGTDPLELAKSLLDLGISIKGGESDDNDGEDPQ